jgi:hypothetical protein
MKNIFMGVTLALGLLLGGTGAVLGGHAPEQVRPINMYCLSWADFEHLYDEALSINNRERYSEIMMDKDGQCYDWRFYDGPDYVPVRLVEVIEERLWHDGRIVEIWKLGVQTGPNSEIEGFGWVFKHGSENSKGA